VAAGKRNRFPAGIVVAGSKNAHRRPRWRVWQRQRFEGLRWKVAPAMSKVPPMRRAAPLPNQRGKLVAF
jgi:hypothetical protein